jgi:hypothetical protein
VGRLQDLSNLILAIAYLLGAIATLCQVKAKAKHDAPPDETDMSVDNLKKEIKSLQDKLKDKQK